MPRNTARPLPWEEPVPHIAGLLAAEGKTFVTQARDALMLTLEWIGGDRHAGLVRRADARTPWHPRGTRIANTRQVSIVSVEDCAGIATRLDLPVVDPALLGANLVVAGLTGLSLLAPATRLQLPSGATIFITEQNAPCRQPAETLAEAHAKPGLLTAFARAAIGRRGVVGIVEREGLVAVGHRIRAFASPARVSAPKVPC